MSRILIGLAAFSSLLISASTLSDKPDAYVASIQTWQRQRNETLRKPDSWLTLAGLYWLREGDNTIGSAESNDLVLPKGSSAASVGRLQVKGGQIHLLPNHGAVLKVNGQAVSVATVLHYNAKDKSDLVQTGTISFYVIKRGDKLGVRAKDSDSPVLKDFQGLKYFPIRPELRFEAKFIAQPKKIPILNVLGQTDLEESPGYVEFTYQGNALRLRPIYEDQTLFFLFKDATNKSQTYQAGRMLNTPLPKDGKVILDFNKAYNPPCTFTPYATCPLPPKENTLSIPIEAGELRYGKGHVEISQR